jgi:hypothetical protein
VGAEDGGDAAVEVPAQGGLFAGGFGVEVDEDDLGVGVALDLGEEVVGLAEGVIGGGHEDAALHVDDGVLGAVAQRAFVEAEAGGAVREVGGADDAAAAHVGVGGDGHVFDNLFFVPDVVAGGDDMRTEVEEFFGDGGGDAEAAGGVFAVDDEEVDGVGFEDVGEVLAYDVAAGRSEDVADEENVHLWILARGRER